MASVHHGKNRMKKRTVVSVDFKHIHTINGDTNKTQMKLMPTSLCPLGKASLLQEIGLVEYLYQQVAHL